MTLIVVGASLGTGHMLTHRSLGEQASVLHSCSDRVLALQRTCATMQVQIARSIVLKALALLSVWSVQTDRQTDR